MQTQVLRVDAICPEPELICRAAAVILRGGLVAFPTETVYGLGADALNAAAVLRIFAAKGRPPNNPIIVHVADATAARKLVSEWPESAERLAGRFWPGPLTFVLARSPRVPSEVTAGGPTVALRVPAHPVARALLEASAVPIAAPSANPSSCLSPTCAEHVLTGLDGRIDLVLDAGATSGGLESTVLDLTTTPPRLLRPGLVSQAELEAIIGSISPPATQPMPAQAPLPAPGMLARHYAPRALLECVAETEVAAHSAALRAQGFTVGSVTFTQRVGAGRTDIEMPRDAAQYAAQLYAVLHALDAAGVDRIVVALPPHTDAWLPIHDRLQRASAR